VTRGTIAHRRRDTRGRRPWNRREAVAWIVTYFLLFLGTQHIGLTACLCRSNQTKRSRRIVGATRFLRDTLCSCAITRRPCQQTDHARMTDQLDDEPRQSIHTGYEWLLQFKQAMSNSDWLAWVVCPKQHQERWQFVQKQFDTDSSTLSQASLVFGVSCPVYLDKKLSWCW